MAALADAFRIAALHLDDRPDNPHTRILTEAQIDQVVAQVCKGLRTASQIHDRALRLVPIREQGRKAGRRRQHEDCPEESAAH